jgi:hypothetical protein
MRQLPAFLEGRIGIGYQRREILVLASQRLVYLVTQGVDLFAMPIERRVVVPLTGDK